MGHPKLWRCMIPHHGTPLLMPNDQLHHLLHRWIREDLAEQVGLGADLSARPRGSQGDAYQSKGGLRRGPDIVMVARAFFKAIGQLTTQQISAAFVRLGYLGRQQAAELINRTDQEVADALSWLTDMQAALGHRKPYPSSCPVPRSTSGQPTLGARLSAVNTKKVLPLLANPLWVPACLQ